jgi:hypothetical protein
MMKDSPQPDPSSIPAFDRAMRAIVAVPKSVVVPPPKAKAPPKRQQSRRKGK